MRQEKNRAFDGGQSRLRSIVEWGPRTVLGFLTGCCLLLIAAPAQASTIFFVRDSNIWVANPDGSGAKPITTDGSAASPYDFVSSAKQGTMPLLAFHRGGDSTSEFGTLHPDGTDVVVNPDNANMRERLSSFTRLDDAGDRVTWGQAHSSGVWFADAVGVDGSSPQEIFRTPGGGAISAPMDARDVTFGNPAGSSLLYTDIGGFYGFNSDDICNGDVSLTDVLVLRTPPPPGQDFGPDPTAVYCQDNIIFEGPALRPDGQLIAAEADPDAAGSSGGIVTMAIGAGVTSATDQTPTIQITPPDSGDSLPDFSPDGAQIAFQRGASTIDTVPAGGGTPTQILTDAAVPAWSPYTLPIEDGGSGGTPGSGPRSIDELQRVSLAARSVRAGRPVTFTVTLKATARITIQILRYVPAKGHGTHRKRAHYQVLGSLTRHGKAGLNKLRVSKLHGHELPAAGYEAKVSAGGRQHLLKFKVHR